MNLEDLYRARHAVQAAEAAAAQAVHRAQKDVDNELLRVRACEQQLDFARDRPAYDTALAALESVKRDHVLALKRLTDRQGEHAHAVTKTCTADVQIANAVDAMLNGEREAIAADCIAIHEKLARRVADLRALVPDEINTQPHLMLDLSTIVTEALNLMPPLDATTIPLNVLRFGAIENREAWATRRSRLIAGEATEEATAA
jgi:hypothetical protein